MGTIFSSSNDYNRALAGQPRKSFGLSKYEVPDNLHQHSPIGTLTIPEPVRNTQLNHPPPVIFNQPLELDQTFVQPDTSPIIDNQLPPPEKPLLMQSSSFSTQPNLPPLKNQIMNKDVNIIYRSVVNLNHHRRINKNQLSLFEPNRSIVERNGKQFVTELKERMERRHVQVFDQTTGRMRLFEVTDYIPSRTVRLMKIYPQNGTSWNSIPRNFSFNHRSTLPAITSGRKEPAASSNLVDFNNLNKDDRIAREFDLYHQGGTLPLNNNINNASHPKSAGQYASDSTYSHSQQKPYNNSTATSQEVPTQYTADSESYQPSSFRHHSPTASDYSVSESTVPSTTSDGSSDSESIDRTIPSNTKHADVSYGTVAGRYSPTQLDPFKKIINPRDPYYKKRQSGHNYSEPVVNTRGFQPSTTSDYAPIPLSRKPSDSNQYSRRRESNGYQG